MNHGSDFNKTLRMYLLDVPQHLINLWNQHPNSSGYNFVKFYSY